MFQIFTNLQRLHAEWEVDIMHQAARRSIHSFSFITRHSRADKCCFFKGNRNSIQYFLIQDSAAPLWPPVCTDVRISIVDSRWDVLNRACPVTLATEFTLGGQTVSWLRSPLRRGPRQPVGQRRSSSKHKAAWEYTCERERRIWKIYLCIQDTAWPQHQQEREQGGKIRRRHFLLPCYWH